MEQMNETAQKLLDMGLAYAPKLVGAVLLLGIGFWITNRITAGLRKRMKKALVDESLRPFLLSMVNVLLKVMIVFSAAGVVGIHTTSFVAILGAAGLAVGLALQGSLSNFASGVLILMFRPYKVGDFITTQGHTGYIREIQIFTTVIATLDNRMVIIPNSAVLSGPIENYTAYPDRMLDLVIGISYGDDIDLARRVVLEEIAKMPQLIKEKTPEVFVKALADSSVNLGVRFWVKSEDYWDAYFAFHENIKKAFDASNVGIPFPQMDVRVHQV
ncbi:MAG: mechanosensitive ion channel [Haliscomenobacter sp.]|nr:mechanosensitive ion channel [Haliscomenobacter sp.]